MMKIGILGGTFNPIHNAHIELGRSALSEYGLDRVLVMPSKRPPHKTLSAGASDEDRVNMCRLVCENNDGFELDLYEMNCSEQTYSYSTLSVYREIYPTDELYFIIGEDSARTFSDWVKPEIISEKADILCGIRNDAGEEKRAEFELQLKILNEKFSGRFLPLNCKNMIISSTDIRDEIRDGAKDWERLVPEYIADYIRERKLYGYNEKR